MPRPNYPQPAGVALHVIQRARTPCFSGERSRLAYLEKLRELSLRFECTVHAYVLMGNHVHLLLTPARAGAAAEMMHSLGADPMWEDGFDASPIHARQYLLGCMRYIEANPVSAQLVTRPGAWRWSSYGANAVGRDDALVTPHPYYYALGRTPEARQAAYRASFQRAACILRGYG